VAGIFLWGGFDENREVKLGRTRIESRNARTEKKHPNRDLAERDRKEDSPELYL
jgi:hypothetical protein